MSADTIRKAIQDAVLEVETFAKAHGLRAAIRRDWKGHATTLAPVSVPVAEREQYRESFAIAAEYGAALAAALN